MTEASGNNLTKLLLDWFVPALGIRGMTVNWSGLGCPPGVDRFICRASFVAQFGGTSVSAEVVRLSLSSAEVAATKRPRAASSTEYILCVYKGVLCA